MENRVIEYDAVEVEPDYDVMSDSGISAELYVNVVNPITEHGYGFVLKQLIDPTEFQTDVIVFSDPGLRKPDEYQHVIVTIRAGEDSRRVLDEFKIRISAVINKKMSVFGNPTPQ